LNKKLAIIGFVSIWIVAIITIVIIAWPTVVRLMDQKNESQPTVGNNSYEVTDSRLIANQNNKDEFFYEKKVFIRHYRNEYDSEEVIVATPIRRIILPKPTIKNNKPITVPQLKKETTGSFDIRPVPVQ
jgi:hypothetical protein